MTAEPQLFRIDAESRESERIAEVDFARLGFQERRDIQEWVAANPNILGDDLLVVGKEFSGFDRTNERLDLLAVDANGKLVVIELKRDNSGTDAHWQAIKYASYLHRASAEDIVRMLADHEKTSELEAEDKLQRHLGADDLNALNNDQRIVLASHRFAPEVTSAALWLNEKAPGEDLITCIQLIPYQDGQDGPLYIQANTIIPVPGIEEYIVNIGDASGGSRPAVTKGGKRAQSIARRSDDISRFLRQVADITISSLPDEIKPDRKSRWAGWRRRWKFRYYNVWYSRPPLRVRMITNYLVKLRRPTQDGSSVWKADLGLSIHGRPGKEVMTRRLADLTIYDDQYWNGDFELLVSRRSDALDDSFADTLAQTLAKFIRTITPIVDELENENNEEDA